MDGMVRPFTNIPHTSGSLSVSPRRSQNASTAGRGAVLGYGGGRAACGVPRAAAGVPRRACRGGCSVPIFGRNVLCCKFDIQKIALMHPRDPGRPANALEPVPRRRAGAIKRASKPVVTVHTGRKLASGSARGRIRAENWHRARRGGAYDPKNGIGRYHGTTRQPASRRRARGMPGESASDGYTNFMRPHALRARAFT